MEMTIQLNWLNTAHQKNSGGSVGVAQLVEHLTFNQNVGGSSPLTHI